MRAVKFESKMVPKADYDKAIGDGVKRIMASEQNTAEVAKRSLYSYRAIKKGEVISADMLLAKRPPGGVNPMETPYIIGMRASADIAPETRLAWNMLEGKQQAASKK